MSERLREAISRIRCHHSRKESSGERRVSATAFRVAVQQRLRNLERDVGELKSRLNGLIFLVIGTVITQVLLKLAQ